MDLDEHDLPDLRVAVPTLEPDEALLQRLAAVAAGSAVVDPPAGISPGSGWRVALAAASVAVVVGGVAALATTVGGEDVPAPPTSPVIPPPGLGPAAPGDTGDRSGDAGTGPGGETFPVPGGEATGSTSSQQPGGEHGFPPAGVPAFPGGDQAPGHADDPGLRTGVDNPGQGDDRGSGRNDGPHGIEPDDEPTGHPRSEARSRLR